MGKIQGKMDSDFTMVHNAFVKDSRLNSSEKGILLVMLQKPVGYRFTVRGLASEMRDGVTSIGAVDTPSTPSAEYGIIKVSKVR